MAHEILGKRFLARSKPGWHNIGEVFPEDLDITAREAMVKVAGDVEVIRRPLFFELDGSTLRAENLCAIIRKPLPDDPEVKILGTTSDSWTASAYCELAEALDPLARRYKVETAGLLQRGGLAFLCFRAQDWDVKGDEMRSYFAANFSLTPGKGHKVFHSPVRVVCWNTNTAAENRATINLSIPHTADAKMKIELAATLAARFEEMKNKTKEIFESFAGVQVTEEQARAVFAAAYPAPNMPPKLRMIKTTLSETEGETLKSVMTADMLIDLEKEQTRYDKKIEITKRLREVAHERFEAFQPNRLRGTAWAAYNAVTEVSDWREGRGADESLLLGSRAREKSRAFAEVAKLADLN